MPPWVSDWVGIPYVKRGRGMDGADCLGLYLMLNEHRLGRTPPDPYCTIASAVRGREADRNAPLYSAVSLPTEGDAILLRQRGFPIHVGYCIDATWMLHTDPSVGSFVERWNGTKWKNRVMGLYRYDGKTI